VRISLDTNVLASGLGTRGLCAELLESVLGNHDLLTSESVLGELERTLTEKFRLPNSLIREYLRLLRTQGEVVVSAGLPTSYVVEATDAEILACAIAGKADVFVTGDKTVLDLGAVEKVPIRSPRQLWQQLAGIEGPETPK
jgi:putative PIN family toxin of toxin-antitoxin system